MPVESHVRPAKPRRASDPPTLLVRPTRWWPLCSTTSATTHFKAGVPGLSASKAARLLVRAESCLASCYVEPVPLLSCDVIVCCGESTEQAERAILSVLAQHGVVTIVHLVNDGGGGAAIVRRFAGRWNVIPHRKSPQAGYVRDLARPLAALTAIGVRGHSRPDGTVSHPKRGRHRGRLAYRGWVRRFWLRALTKRPPVSFGRDDPATPIAQVPYVADPGLSPRIPAGHGRHSRRDRADSDAELIFRSGQRGPKVQ